MAVGWDMVWIGRKRKGRWLDLIMLKAALWRCNFDRRLPFLNELVLACFMSFR